jgi:hypothetical protein
VDHLVTFTLLVAKERRFGLRRVGAVAANIIRMFRAKLLARIAAFLPGQSPNPVADEVPGSDPQRR